MATLATMYIAGVPEGSSVSERSFHRMFWKRGSGRVRLQGGGDDEGCKTKEETDVTESKKYCKSLSLERSRLELRSVLYLYKRNKNKVFFFLIKFLFIFT